MTARRHLPARRASAASVALLALLSLSACATFGGNVRGDFSCAAPDGICAPSSTIDDRALALITHDAAADQPLPTSDNDRRPMPRGHRAAAARPARLATGDATRTRERVLRIVFQPYIDDRGRLHEASAIHAVVARGEWQQQALSEAAVRPALASGSAPHYGETLAEAVDRADPPGGMLAAIELGSHDPAAPDAAAPDAAAVAAARARKPDPVAAIKADVARRLAPKPDGRGRGRRDVPVAGRPDGIEPAPVASALEPQVLAPVRGLPAGEAPAIVLPRATAAQRAAEKVKADPAYRAAAGAAAKDAQAMAVDASGKATAAAPSPTVKAAAFPAAVAGED
jgi:conjugal transfer pilus assembly protein TraV